MNAKQTRKYRKRKEGKVDNIAKDVCAERKRKRTKDDTLRNEGKSPYEELIRNRHVISAEEETYLVTS